MKKTLTILLLASIAITVACKKIPYEGDDGYTIYEDPCENNNFDFNIGETGLDCGGNCSPCKKAEMPACSGLTNQDTNKIKINSFKTDLNYTSYEQLDGVFEATFSNAQSYGCTFEAKFYTKLGLGGTEAYRTYQLTNNTNPGEGQVYIKYRSGSFSGYTDYVSNSGTVYLNRIEGGDEPIYTFSICEGQFKNPSSGATTTLSFNYKQQ